MMSSASWKRRIAAMLACLGVAIAAGPGVALGGITNAIPFSDSFESYTNGTFLGPNQGWYSWEDEENLRVITAPSTYTLEWPLNATHTNYLSLLGSVTNPVSDADFDSEHAVYLDLLMKPRRWVEDNPPTVTNGPNDAQMAFYVNSNGYVTVWCGSFDLGGNLQDPTNWVTLSHTPIPTNTWIRMTLSLKYNVSLFGRHFFQIRVNNSVNLTNYVAQTTPTAWGTHYGSWFVMAEQGNFGVRQVEFRGQTLLDDYVVTNAQPNIKQVWTVKSLHSAGVSVDPSPELVTVLEGSNVTFNYTVAEGYDITNVLWGVGHGDAERTNALGIVTTHTFTNVLQDHSIFAGTKLQKRTLVVTSPLGIPSPAGATEHDYNTLIEASVAGSPAGSALSLTSCVGWVRSTTLSGFTTNGAGTNVSFNIRGTSPADTNNLDWLWKVQNWLSISGAPPGKGSVSAASGWYNADQVVTSTASATAWGWYFNAWSGDTNGATFPVAYEIHVLMDQPRSIVAGFAEQAYGANGTPIGYLREHGLTDPYYTNPDDAELGDWDGDGLLNWEEYVAGTDPTNALSVFEVLVIDHGSPSNKVVFYGTTNHLDPALPFGMYRGTNLMQVNPWTLLPVSIPRSLDGTNIWWDVTPPVGVPAFYMPVATNPPPGP
jgi:hypothetical protein